MENQVQLRSIWDSVVLWFNEQAVDVAWNIIGIILIFIIGQILISWFKRVLKRLFARTKKINDLMERLLSRTLVGFAQLILIMIILGRLNVDLAPVIAGLGVTGFILGFAFQETIGNLLAGVMIAINSPFRVGDYVEIGSISGSVKDMDMMSVTLATPDNKRVVMANKLIWGHAIVNYTYTDNRRVEMGVSIAYDSDVDKAKELIASILAGYPEILADPKPVIEVGKLGDSSVDIVVRPWSKPADYWTIFFRFQQDVLEKFREAKIEIPFPQLDVHSS
ncbi:MAG: mechanosensitive ion channel family protein [Sphaerochaetaceae bacterium]|nr:mechanosensitive ion channel family protein [Sphaerochaetaceae bacterium]MDC7246993.1 mechanosensitive ion channel family protein [Sphaerochaetaceae bacterium]